MLFQDPAASEAQARSPIRPSLRVRGALCAVLIATSALLITGTTNVRAAPASSQPASDGANETGQTPPLRLGSPSEQSSPRAPLTTAPTGPSTTQPSVSGNPANPNQNLGTVLVTSSLDAQREQIAPALGAVTYTIGPNQIQDIPGGENTSFQQVLLRAPGVVEDSFGQEHIRGEHANLTYRVNGVLLPQPINVFGQELDTRLVNSVTLIDGTLPAQFGFHTAGIVDVTTKSGATLQHNELSLYGGMYDTIEPSLQLGGTTGKLDYFITASNTHNGIGIESPTPSHRPLHDYTDQQRLFTYLNYRIDDTSRLSVFVNGYNGDFQIPNVPNGTPAFTLGSIASADSAKNNENQNEQEYYSVVAYQKTLDQLSFQISGFSRYGQITFKPDVINDLIFQGVAAGVYNSYLTNGVQFDGAYILNDQHTIRAGLIADYSNEKNDTDSQVFPADSSGAQTSDFPITISENTGNHATESGIYLQDEWKILPSVTVNYGLRYDRFDANFDTEDQVSPRANVVWKIDDRTTTHAGYARYFVPPPVQDLTLADINRFNGTTNAPASPGDNAPRVERSNYYDVGLSRQLNKAFLVNFDGFYKEAKQLVDLGQFGDAIILSPYNYARGSVAGAEFSSTYKQDGLSAFANFSWVRTLAHDIDTQQFSLGSDELAYIAAHNIPLDHESEYTVSAGAAYTWKDNRVYIDYLYGSGLRYGFANQHQESQYSPVNIGYEHIFRGGILGKNAVKFRVDVVNVFDEPYQLRQGGGLGVNASQFGQRRSIFAGLTYEF